MLLELLVDLVTAHAAEIVLLRIEEQALEQAAGVRHGGWVARAQAAVDVLQRFFFVVRRVLLQGLDDRVVGLGIDDLHVLHAEREDLADGRLGQRLESARHGDFAVADVGDEHLGRDLLFLEALAELQLLDGVEELDDLLVRAVAEGAQERGREELPAALAAVEIDVEQVVRVELHFHPRAAIGNDAEAEEHLAIEMQRALEADARRTVQLRDHDALRAVDDERALRGHERDFAHVDFLFLGAVLFLEQESDVQRRAEGLPFAHRLADAQLRLADLVAGEIQRDFFVVAGDGENFLEDRLEAGVLALGQRHIRLEELDVRIELDFNEVGRLGAFPEFTEVFAFRHGDDARWTGCCWVAFAPPPAGGARVEKVGLLLCRRAPRDAKTQRHRNAGDDMHPLRFGVSAEMICERRAAAVVKDKKPRGV